MSKLYVVQRRTWFEACFGYDDEDCIEGGGVPVAAYAKKRDAKAHADRLQAGALAEASSPFRLVNMDWAEINDLQEDRLVAAVRRLGLEPPEAEDQYAYRPWAHWYDEIADALTPKQRDGLFALFAKVVVYEVVEMPLEE